MVDTHKNTGTLRQHAQGLQASAPDGVLELEGEGVQMSLTQMLSLMDNDLLMKTYCLQLFCESISMGSKEGRNWEE